MKRIIRLACVLATLFAADLRAAEAHAQNYSFSVPSLKMEVHVRPDASARIIYDIKFSNFPGAQPIDVVDVGTPHAGYALNNVTASLDGTRLLDIRKSEYVDPGFEVHLGSQTIQPGRQGTLHVEFNMPDLVYQDTTRSDYASIQITPTWFGEQFVRGNSDVIVAVHLPAGFPPEQVLSQKEPFSRSEPAGDDGQTVVSWFSNRRAVGPYLVGVSFPKSSMTRVVRQTKFGLLLKWFKESPQARSVAGLIFLACFGFLFFRFSGGTGISIFVVLSVALVVVFVVSPAAHLIGFLPLLALVGLNEWALRRRRLTYLPAIAEVEGGGIRRGLTAPEAAVLLELPLCKVLALVIFGLLKKRIVRQVQADPLIVEVNEPFRAPQEWHGHPRRLAKFYRHAAQQEKTVVHDYEHAFLSRLQSNAGKPVGDVALGTAVKGLIKHVARRLKGFDLSDTQDYYRSIVRRAMLQAGSIAAIEPRQEVLDRDLQWILMDDGYSSVFSQPGYHYVPAWTRSTTSGTGGGTTQPTSAAPGGTTSFSDVAASFAGWTENTMGSVASAIEPGSIQAKSASGGVIDLSGVDRATADALKAMGESSGSGGGFSGGGCACAGCACACACAGGGR